LNKAYGRVANLKTSEASTPNSKTDDNNQSSLVEHFTSLLLAVFVDAGLLEVRRLF
jgi:rapamycin-insensitive companion of mTOR